jgi:hypothetical protein
MSQLVHVSTRDTETGDTARVPAQCPGRWATGTNKVIKWCGEENDFFSGLTRAPRLDKNVLYRHDEPKEPTKEGKDPFQS